MKLTPVARPYRDRPLRVLVLSRNYPNNVLPLLGLWVEGQVRHVAKLCTTKVVAPSPYCPPLPGIPERYARFRRVDRHQWNNGIEIFRPRFVVPPGYWLHGYEAIPYFLGVVGLMDRLHRTFAFDLIHAQFTYPDGYVAARLGQRYGVPVVITEQAPWRPWMDDYPRVRQQAVWAVRRCAFHIALSNALRDTVVHFTGESQKLQVIPNGVDASTFTLSEHGSPPSMNQILFVGIIRPVKGVDVLLEAMRLVADRRPDVRLALVGEPFYTSYHLEFDRLVRMVSELGLREHVKFVGAKQGAELARYMQQSALLVLPSRMESFGLVLAEALACGTPVVATRSGGPEDIVNDEVGVLVPPEDPDALARGIEHVLGRRGAYDASKLRAYALERFSIDSVAKRIYALYEQAVQEFGGRQAANP